MPPQHGCSNTCTMMTMDAVRASIVVKGMFLFFIYFLNISSPTPQPTVTSHVPASHHPTSRYPQSPKKSPNDASQHISWALGIVTHQTTTPTVTLHVPAHITPETATLKAHKKKPKQCEGSDGQRSQKRAQTMPDTSFGP